MAPTPKMLIIFKPEGLTPLQALTLFRKENPFYKDKKLGYAGTLDPLAEGLLLILVGEENKKRHFYINLPKKYTFSFFLGIKTDTYDILGLPTKKKFIENIDIKKIEEVIKTFEGEIVQTYPPFSSKRVKGRALFMWAKEGALKEISRPSEKRSIFDIGIQEIIPLTGRQLLKIIEKKISKISGDFRQKKILHKWRSLLSKEEETIFFIISAYAHVSSGTYIRGIVDEIGKALSCGATTLSITRTHIGRFSIEKAQILKEGRHQ